MKTMINKDDVVILDKLVQDGYLYLITEFLECIPEFKGMSQEELIDLHPGLGQELRNHLKLWEMQSDAAILTHPDDMSMRIIEELHEILNNPSKVEVLVTAMKCRDCQSPIMFITRNYKFPFSTGYCSNPLCSNHKETAVRRDGKFPSMPFSV